jgi:predicted nucleic acid-binding protein
VVTVYLDGSVLVALFTNDPFTARAKAYLTANSPIMLVSDFAAAEFASAVSRRVRAEASTADIAAATSVLRRLDLNLRTPDAINIAIADRLGATVATFDERMATAARALGVQVAPA